MEKLTNIEAELKKSIAYQKSGYFPFCFGVSVFTFQIRWMVTTVIKARFSLRKTLITSLKSQPCLLITVYRVEFTSWKTLIACAFSLLYASLFLSLLLSQKHMACHAFTHQIWDLNKCLSHKVCVRIEPHSSN